MGGRVLKETEGWRTGAQHADLLTEPTSRVLLGPSFVPPGRNHGWKRHLFLNATALANATVAFLSVGIARLIVDGEIGATRAYLGLAVSAAAVVGIMSRLSRPDRQRSAGAFLEEWIEAGKEAIVAGITLVCVTFFWRPEVITRFSFSRATVLAAVPLLFIFVGLSRTGGRLLLLRLRHHGYNLASVVVVGESASADAFVQTMAAKAGTGYRVVARLDLPESGHELAATLRELSHTVSIDEIVLASFSLSASQMEALVTEPALQGVRVRTVPEMFGLPPSKVEIVSFAGFPLLTLFENPVRGPRWKLKRSVDVLVALSTLLVLSPAMLVIAAAIKLTSKGPVLFRQERVGMDGKPFCMLKFRTMHDKAPDSYHRDLMETLLSGSEAAPDSKGFFKAADDPRITRVGRLLRRYSLDELPQFLNVVRGEMSLVGPRPALSYEVALYEEWQRRRLHVLPGITGLWQVSGRSRLSPADMLRLDVHYAETWSLPSDFLIMLRTIPAVLRDDAR